MMLPDDETAEKYVGRVLLVAVGYTAVVFLLGVALGYALGGF